MIQFLKHYLKYKEIFEKFVYPNLYDFIQIVDGISHYLSQYIYLTRLMKIHCQCKIVLQRTLEKYKHPHRKKKKWYPPMPLHIKFNLKIDN